MMVVSLGGLSAHELDFTKVQALLYSTTGYAGLLLAGPLGMLAAAGLAGSGLQGRAPLAFNKMAPDFSRLNPATNLGRLVSIGSFAEVLKALLKMAVYGAVAYTAARDAILSNPAGAPGAEGTLLMLLSLGWTVFFRVTLLAAGLSVLDYLLQRYRYRRGLMMSKKEIKDEMKEMDGDPLIRARIRSKQAAMARSRMMAEVPKATVVVTNPTRFAVALRYVPGDTEVPKVLAKGREKIAQRIREIAEENRIPIVSDPPLARALYKSVPVGAEIPQTLFRAVAEVLALVLSRRSKRAASRPPAEEAVR